MTPTRTLYVISDLHLGGAATFRMMTHVDVLARFIDTIANAHAPGTCELVINGDFVDFLAHDHGPPQRWKPFLYDEAQARACFDAIAAGEDAAVFDALARLLARGQRLTILLGNHDIELALPSVRAALRARLGVADTQALRFVHDGEAYVVGDVLIEHGNRYDNANQVDHERLHQWRVKQTLRQTAGEPPFDPPFGSKLVAGIMNPIKSELRFIDLLKPEGPALIGVLLAIAPEQREQILALCKLYREHRGERKDATAVARKETRFRGGSTGGARGRDEDLAALLDDVLGPGLGHEVDVGRREVVMRGPASDVWQMLRQGGIEVLRMIGTSRTREVERLELLRRAIHKIAPPESEALESSPYYDAATTLAQHFRLIVFGHTHGAMHEPIGPSARYINTGTWANLMAFPPELLDASVKRARGEAALAAFLAALEAGHLDAYLRFEPHYAKIRVDDHERLCDAELLLFRG